MTIYNDNRSIIVKTENQIQIMYEANQIVANVHKRLRNIICDGVTTKFIDKLASDYCKEFQAIPAFLGYRGFPGNICVSINEQVVHGIPSDKVTVHDGDIVSLDFGVLYKGYYGDAAITVPVGKISPEKQRLLTITENALELGIEQVRIGNRISDISMAIQQHVELSGFSVVRQFVGHGIGTSLHEAPEVPNYLQNKSSPRIIEGMVLAIEPMVNCGTFKVKILKDGWTVVTADGMPSAHFEHTVAATLNGPLVLSR